MARLTNDQLKAENRALKDQLRRVETMAEAWRRRKGELFCLLQEHAPEVAKAAVPPADWHSRYVVLDRIVERATSLALKMSSFPQECDEDLEGLIEAVLANEYYWRQVDAERVRRQEVAAKASQTKREKEAANGQ